MTIIELNKKLYTIPTTWNELSQQQLLEIMETMFTRAYTGEQALLKLMKILCNMNYWQFFRTKPTELDEFFYLTEFLLQERTHLTKQLMPVYKNMYGPADDFDNLVMSELVFSDNYFLQWAENKEDLLLLDELCAIMFRPCKINYDTNKDPDGDPRIEYNQNLCSWNAKHVINKWPLAAKLAIATWYDACRWNLVDENEEVFGGSGDPSKYGLVSVMMNVAETHVLGDFTNIEKTRVKLVMIQLNEGIAKAKAIEKQMKSTT